METEEKKLYEVKMAGFPVRVVSSHSKQRVDELVSLVDEKIHQVLKDKKGTSFQKALCLVSLNFAEELSILKQKSLSLLQRIENQIDDILTDVESSSKSSELG